MQLRHKRDVRNGHPGRLLRAMVGLLAVWIVVFPAGAAGAQDLVSVAAHGAAGDGAADDTQAFLSAVQEAQETGRQVFVPRGEYKISETIELNNVGVTGPPVGAWPADCAALPSILPTHSDGPAFHLLAGASLQGIDITCSTDPKGDDGPAAVLISGIGVFINNCRIRYPWDGIITDGKANVGRLNIDNVFIVSPRNVGVRVTGTWDVPALRNIEVWNAGPVPRGLEKGIGFHLGKNDLIRMTDCFAFAMRYGYLFEDTIEGCEIEGGTWGVLTGCSTDYCGTGIAIRGNHTLSITGGTYWDHAESVLMEEGTARIRVCGAELKSNGAPSIVINECDHAVVTGCSILRSMEGFDAPAVVIAGGKLVLSGNYVEAYGDGVHIGADVEGAVIHNNLISPHGNEAIVMEAKAGERTSAEGNMALAEEEQGEAEGEGN